MPYRSPCARRYPSHGGSRLGRPSRRTDPRSAPGGAPTGVTAIPMRTREGTAMEDADRRATGGAGRGALRVDAEARAALLAVHERLRIDDVWTAWHDDGFTWWAHRLAQRIRVEGPHDVGGRPTYWASFATATLRGVAPADGQERTLRASVGRLNRAAHLYEIHRSGERLGVRGRVFFRPETRAFRARLLADRALLAVTWAERQADALAAGGDALGLAEGVAVDAVPHPRRGARPDADAMLDAVDAVFLPRGREAPRAEGATDLRAAADVLAAAAGRVGGDPATGVVDATLREGDLAARVTLRAQAEHAGLGRGMLARVHLRPPALDAAPPGSDAAHAASLDACATLNEASWSMPWPVLHVGAWTPDGDAPKGVAYATFHPNATLVPGLARALAYDALGRVRFAQPLLVGRASGDVN